MESQIAEGDLEFFQVIDQVGEAAGYQKYLEKYPGGALAEIAHNRVRSLSGWRHGIRKLPTIALVATLATCVAAYAAYQSIPTPNPDVAKIITERDTALADVADRNTEIAKLSTQMRSLQDQEKSLLAQLKERETQNSDASRLAKQQDIAIENLEKQERQAELMASQIAQLRKENLQQENLFVDSLAREKESAIKITELSLSLEDAQARIAEFENTDLSGQETETLRTGLVAGVTVVKASLQMSKELGNSVFYAGVAVVAVDPDSEAFRKGLRRGDIIVESGQQKISNPAEWNETIELAKKAGRKSILVLVRRNGEPRFIALSI